MPTAEPAMAAIEIIPPDGRVERPERRHTAAFRPYSSLDGCTPETPPVVADRRRCRRAKTDFARGRCLNLES